MKICLHIDVESSARGHFVKKKILYFSETIHIAELFSGSRNPAKYKIEHFAKRLDSL